MKDELFEFVEKLASYKTTGNVFNHYSPDFPDNLIRRENLLLYLRFMKEIRPEVILIGEAPGYHGCRLTGVPFTSEFILLNDLRVFGKEKGYRKTNEVARKKKEQSATIVWETLNYYRFLPLMWNAFPFHPYQPTNCEKNRTPSTTELDLGQSFLKDILKLFDLDKVVALGGNAEKSLNKMRIECSRIRHPANGGKADFVKGIEELFQGYQR